LRFSVLEGSFVFMVFSRLLRHRARAFTVNGSVAV